ncbi:hypothetical protein CXB51_023272 [Gossypium anomalum]|uniref:RNase H type-1 domain-containing protein n=1 Tax=Gossypium anomalum TaxID=47600 RepID=A0A8J6CV60_9ROSI|nr:hypothetical protein CXB51_023272 [Gossypium anomalum]
MRMVENFYNYLGLHLPIHRKQSTAFTNVINRCICRINSWSKRLLSYGGKEVFLKAILQSIPTYAISVLLAPKGIIEEIHSKMSRMWWTSNDKTRGWAMMAWNHLCYPKGVGGMGFRDMHVFNLALLSKQVWRLVNFKDTLCFKVLSAKYFPEGDVFWPKWCDRLSFTWMSIAKAAATLKDSLNNRLLEGRYERCIDWLEDALRELDSKAVADFFTLLWNCWNNRNKLVFQGKEDPTRVPKCKGWKKPPKDFVKINVDAAIFENGAGYGVIIKYANGFVLGGCYGFANKTLDVIWAELETLSMGLKLADSMKIPKLIVESDNETLINTVNKREKDGTILGQCIKKECMIIRNFDSVLFNWIDRRSNEAADSLSKLAIKNNCNLNFKMDYPLEIHKVIIREAIK